MSAIAPRPLPQAGDPGPWFTARCTSNEKYHFSTTAGRNIVLCFLRSGANAYSRALLEGFLVQRETFDDVTAAFFAVTVDPEDERQQRLRERLPGYRVFWDFDLNVSLAYGVVRDPKTYNACSVVLDSRLRVLAVVPFAGYPKPDQHVAAVMRVLAAQPVPDAQTREEQHAPVLVVPRVFETDFCRELIEYYERAQPRESGVMQERDGKTVLVLNDLFKRRRDTSIEDEALRLRCREKLIRRLKPEVHKAFQFNATYAERYIVACYDSTSGGFFKPHRDNTTKGTAHRRFAVTINLNTGEYEGGCLRFPEFGQQTYAAPLGGAVVFSCSLLHEATPVANGRRYAFLPFLYDDAAAKIREQNQGFVELDEAS